MFSYELRVPGTAIPLLKSVGGRWLPKKGVWSVPRHPSVAKKLAPVVDAADVQDDLTRYERLLSLHNSSDAAVEHGCSLEPYQRVGVRFLADAGRAILGDDVGVGKSSQAIRAALEVGAKRVLVITKKSLLHQWVREIERWAGGGDEAV